VARHAIFVHLKSRKGKPAIQHTYSSRREANAALEAFTSDLERHGFAILRDAGLSVSAQDYLNARIRKIGE
jgi:hypothetical protein